MPPHDDALLRCTAWVCALACALGEHAGASAYEWGYPYEQARAALPAAALRRMERLLPTAPPELREAAAHAYVAGWEEGAREAFALTPDA